MRILPYEIKDLVFFPYLSINVNYSCLFFRCDNRNFTKNQEKCNENLLSNKTFGFLSETSKSKIRKAINLLLYLSPKHKTCIVETKKEFTYQITFTTLTLPSKQIHSDTEITQKCLHDFLNILRQNYNLLHYVWKAEKQENGNIHYHLTTNIFIHWKDLREIWNNCIERLGYVSRYSKNMREFHKYGFKVRTELLHKWTYLEQKSAFEYGQKTNWQSPNSTDIHSVINIKDLAAYVSEYFTKQPLSDIELEEYKHCTTEIKQSEIIIKKLENQIKTTDYKYGNELSEIKENITFHHKKIAENTERIKKYSHLFVTSRVWFLSRTLSGFKFSISLDSTVECEELEYYMNNHKNEVKQKDSCTLIFSDIKKLAANGCKNLKNSFDFELENHIAMKTSNREYSLPIRGSVL
jgi:hypothetical protein